MDIGVFLNIMYVVLAVLAVVAVVNGVLVIKKIKNGNLGIIRGVFKIFSVVFACIIAVFAIFVINGEMEKQGDNVLALHPYGIPEITYGDVFNEYCWDMQWSRLAWDSSTSGMAFIQLDGTCEYQGKEQSIVMQFNIGKREFDEFEKEPYFYINFIALDDADSISEEEMEDLLYSMFTQYIEEKGLSISIPESKKSALLYSENAPWYDDTEIETSDEDTEEEITEEEIIKDEATDTTESEEIVQDEEETSELPETAYINTSDIAGAYVGMSLGGSMSISIYSSPDGQSVGNIEYESEDGTLYYGELYLVNNTIYMADTDVGTLEIQMYYIDDYTLGCKVEVNGTFVDAYAMIEHYMS